MWQGDRFGRVFTDLTFNKSSTAQLQVALSLSIYCPRLQGKMRSNIVQDNVLLTATHLAQHLSAIFNNHCLRTLPAYPQCTSAVITLSSALPGPRLQYEMYIQLLVFQNLRRWLNVLKFCFNATYQSYRGEVYLRNYHGLTSFSVGYLLGNGRRGKQRSQHL